MKIEIYNDYEALSEAAAKVVMAQVANKPDSLLCFPSGETPTGMLRFLVKAAQEKKIDFSQCFFIGLDELVGMNGDDERSFRTYLNQKIFEPLNIMKDKIIFFDGCLDPVEECNRIQDFLNQHGPIDLIILGIGMNGHLGMNEPESAFDSPARLVTLAENTRNVTQKYFKEHTVLKEGLTLGMKDIAESKTVMLMASGQKKAAIVKTALNILPTTGIPASLLQQIGNSLVFLDKEAASELDA